MIGLDDPVASVWPEFAAGAKTGRLRHALCHRAGVPAIREPLTNDDLGDWERMAAALAATEPWWEPGTRHAYHTNTYGHLIGEVVRRVTAGPGARLAAVVGPLDADLTRRPAAEQHRWADVVWAAGAPAVTGPHAQGDARMERLGYFNPPGYSSMGVVNTPAWRGRGPLDQRARHGPRGGPALRRPARAGTTALARAAGRGDLPSPGGTARSSARR